MPWIADETGAPRWVTAMNSSRHDDVGEPWTDGSRCDRPVDGLQDLSVDAMDTHLVRAHRAKLEHRLALAERHVQVGEAQIAKQRELVAELERCGYDSAIARATLKQAEQLQKRHLNDRDILRSELAFWDEAAATDHPLAPL